MSLPAPRADNPAVSSAGALAGGVDLPGYDCVERRVVALGAGDKVIEQLHTSDAAVADLAGKLRRGGKGAVVHIASLGTGQNGTLPPCTGCATAERQR